MVSSSSQPPLRFKVDAPLSSPVPSSLLPRTHMPVEIKIRKGEIVDKALRRLKKKVDREGIIKDARSKRGYEKPCERRRRKGKVKAFNSYLRKKWEHK